METTLFLSLSFLCVYCVGLLDSNQIVVPTPLVAMQQPPYFFQLFVLFETNKETLVCLWLKITVCSGYSAPNQPVPACMSSVHSDNSQPLISYTSPDSVILLWHSSALQISFPSTNKTVFEPTFICSVRWPSEAKRTAT